MAYKLWMTAMLSFFDDDLKLAVALASVGVYMAVILLANPYLRKGDDRLHLLLLAQTMALITTTQTLVSVESSLLYQGPTDFILSAGLILLVLGGVFVFLGMCVQNVRKMKVLKNFGAKQAGLQDAKEQKHTKSPQPLEQHQAVLISNPLHMETQQRRRTFVAFSDAHKPPKPPKPPRRAQTAKQ